MRLMLKKISVLESLGRGFKVHPKLLSLIMAAVLVLPLSTPVLAAERNVETTDKVVYTDTETGDIMTIESISNTSRAYSRNRSSGEDYMTQVSRNGVLEETLVVNFEDDKLTHIYPNGEEVVERLSDIVTITEIEDDTEVAGKSETESEKTFATSSSRALTRGTVDYIDNEPFYIDTDGRSVPLDSTYIYTGYRTMGCRGGFDVAPNLYGYLQRNDTGLYGSYVGKEFNFSVGTSVEAAVSIIRAAYESIGWRLAVKIITSCVNVVVGNWDVIEKGWSVDFLVCRYRWNYDVRLNSDYGPIIYETYRTKDFVRCYSEVSRIHYYEYRGSEYDTGIWVDNYTIIKHAIELYVAQHS